MQAKNKFLQKLKKNSWYFNFFQRSAQLPGARANMKCTGSVGTVLTIVLTIPYAYFLYSYTWTRTKQFDVENRSTPRSNRNRKMHDTFYLKT